MKKKDVWNLIVHNIWALIYFFEALFQFFVQPPKKSVQGKVVLVTGAGNGIGQGMVIEFIKLGATVVGWDISAKGLATTKNMLNPDDQQSKWHSFVVDLSVREDVYQTAQKVQSLVGKVDILINNAGVVTGKSFLECDDEDIIKTMDVNTMAHFWTLKSFLPNMLKDDDGHIVSIASSAGFTGMPGMVDYCASKFASVGMAEALDSEIYAMKKQNVHLTLVCPFAIDTGMFDGFRSPFLRMLKPKEVVDAVVDGVLRNKRHVLIPFEMKLGFLKWVLPVKTNYELMNGMQLLDCMKLFTGRK